MKADCLEKGVVIDFFEDLRLKKDFGNARDVRNFVENCLRKQSLRLHRAIEAQQKVENLYAIIDEDICAAINENGDDQ